MQKIILIWALITGFSIQANCQRVHWVIAKDTPDSRVFDRIYTKVDLESAFVGGAAGWRNYCMQNLSDKTATNNGAPRGVYTVIVKFIVWRNGVVSDVSAETNFGFGTENEAIKVIKTGPKWMPATVGGQAVSSWRRQPITFVAL